MNSDTLALVDGLRAGDRRSLAKAITLVESTKTEHRREASDLMEALLPDTRWSTRIGISGPPGVGKSTFIETFGLHLRSLGYTLAVLAVDPSSARSGGSILGDKTRMSELAADPQVFIRPTPGSGHLGGVARRTRESLALCEAFGVDIVIVETIGVGQSEIEIAEMVDAFLLLASPTGGDELQGIKRGIMELADLIVINKSDGELVAAADRARASYVNAVSLLRPKWRAWVTETMTCSALENTGVAQVWEAVERLRTALTESGELAEHRSAQSVAWLWDELRDALIGAFESSPRVANLLQVLETEVAQGRRSPTAAAQRLLEAYESGGG